MTHKESKIMMITEQEFKNAVRTIEKYKDQCESGIRDLQRKKAIAEEVIAKKNNYGLSKQTKIDLLGDLEFSVRTTNCLRFHFDKRWEEITLGDICSMSKKQLLEIRNFGKTSLHEIEEILIKANLNFA